MRLLTLLLALAACHNATTDVEHDDLRDEVFTIAEKYRSTMCACKTAACADELDGRYQHWLRQMEGKVNASDEHNSYSATIGEDGAKQLDGIFRAYQSCKNELVIRKELGREHQ